MRSRHLPAASALAVLAVFALSAPLAAQSPSQALERLRRADANWSYLQTDFSAEYTIVQDTPGEGRTTTVAAVFRRDREDIYTIIILEPAVDRGQGYVKQGDTLWLYDAESGRFSRTSSRERFQNSNARNSDFTRSTLAQDYQILSVTPTTLGRFDAYLYELESDLDGVTYPYTKVWITDDGRILKTEDYSLSRQLLRVTAVPAYRTINDKAIPETVYIIDMLEGAVVDAEFANERTIITVSRPSFDPVPDNVFTRAFLERMSR